MIDVEGIAATSAARRAKKRDLAPTGKAKRSKGNDRHTTVEATRRQHQIEKATPKAAQMCGRGKARHRIIVIRDG
jgi:hypothetical protein